jgi:hypothetical protein
MSANDRCAEALSVLRQGGTLPADHPALREFVVAALAEGRDGLPTRLPVGLARAIRDHNAHLDPYDPDLGGDDHD